MNDIQKYNPFPAFQPGQAEAIHEMLGYFNAGQKVVELNAPTAAGKSLDLFVFGRMIAEQTGARVIYTTPLVALVNQLENEPAFKAMPVLKGKRNYNCGPLSEALGGQTSAEDCPFDSWDDAQKAIPACANCQYHMAYKAFMASNFGATTLARYQMPGTLRDETTILLVDESAGLERVLIDRATLRIPEKVGLANLAQNLITYYHELQVEIEKLTKLIASEKTLAKKVELNKERNKLSQESRKCSKVLAHLEKGHPYIIDKERKFRLLEGKSEFEDMIEDLTFVVLASGTPNTAILTDNYKSVVINHPIPIERRQVYYEPVGSMAMKERQSTAPKIAKKIDQLHKEAGSKKTMVHCGSYVVASLIYDSMPNKSICILQNQKDREGSKAKFLNAKDDTIFLSVAFEEGLDLKGPDYPLNIIAKLNFENISDEFIQARNDRDKYRRYNTNTAIATMQAAGRCTRTPKDYSKTYILDSSWQGFFTRCRKLFQPWFIASLKDSKTENQIMSKSAVNSQVTVTKLITKSAVNSQVDKSQLGNVETALLYLAGKCDGAITKDGQGFNGRDTDFGHSLADQISRGRNLSPKQRVAAIRMCQTYKGQLSKANIVLD